MSEAKAPIEEEVQRIVEGCLRAIDLEIESVLDDLTRWGGDKPVVVMGGQVSGYEGESVLYQIALPRPIYPPDNTGVEVIPADSDKRFRGHVEQTEPGGRMLTISLESAVPGTIEGAQLNFDATHLLRAMQMRLTEATPAELAAHLPFVRALGLVEPVIRDEAIDEVRSALSGLVEGQQAAVRRGTGSDLALVLGPPGTGKTRTLGVLVGELAESRGKRVLVVAHTNRALDTAMAAVLPCLPAEWKEDGRVLRSGRISREFEHLGIGYQQTVERAMMAAARDFRNRISALETETDLVAPAPSRLAGRERPAKSPGLHARVRQLANRLDSLPASVRGSDGVAGIAGRVAELAGEMANIAGSLETRARVVGATLSKLALEGTCFGMFDAVVIDEASMASIPHALIATLSATSQVAVFGDPCQLNPIVQSRHPQAAHYLGRNLYHHLNLTDPALDDPRMPMLVTQFRMSPRIRELDSELFYAGRLEDAAEVSARTPDPFELVLIDTSLAGVTSGKKGKSRTNPEHAELVARIAREISAEGETDIGIVTPFYVQSKITGDQLRMHYPGFRALGGTVGTVHRSQGGEKNVIIVDTVDAPPNMSSFLDADWNRDLPNLLNVAISRARHRLIVIAHAQGFRMRYGRRGALIMRILEEVSRKGHYVAVPQGGIGTFSLAASLEHARPVRAARQRA